MTTNRTKAVIETQLKQWRAKRQKIADKAASELHEIDQVIAEFQRTSETLGGERATEPDIAARPAAGRGE